MPVNIRIEPILPKKKDYPLSEFKELKAALKKWLLTDAANLVQSEMEKTTEGWNTAPSFPAVYSEPYGTRMQIVVEPKGKGTLNWKRISEGTGPRPITSNTVMVFPINYAPKTTPGGRYGGPGKKSGPIARTKQVAMHQIKARKFSLLIAGRITPRIERDAQAVVNRALR